jgi:hypothetical protein
MITIFAVIVAKYSISLQLQKNTAQMLAVINITTQKRKNSYVAQYFSKWGLPFA